ncbi:MAG TPA: cation diffusion facilitator family transporter [Vicinamibacteria bacterium]
MASAEITHQGVRRVLVVTLLLNLAVSAGKIGVGLVSGSLAMVADGYHSLVDGANNVIGLIVAAFAYAPPDRGHPYGHRKFETAATVAIGGALLALAYQVVFRAFASAGRSEAPAIGWLNWAVMFATMGMNLFVSWYEAREGRRLGSEYLRADATHTRSDLYVSLGVIASFAAAQAGLRLADAAVAALIGAVIAFQAVQILLRSFHVLTDRAVLAPETVEAAAGGVPGVLAVREVRTRGSEDAVYVDLIAHVDGAMSLRAAHDVADHIERVVKTALPAVVDVVVHLEPEQP